MSPLRNLSRLFLALAIPAAACGEGTGPVPSSVAEIGIDSAAGPLIRTVTVRLSEAAPVEVTYGATDGSTPVLTIAADSAAIEHRVILPRLRAAREYRVEARVSRPGERALTRNFRTGALPPSLAPIRLFTTGQPSLPVALIEVVGGTQFTGLLIVEDGEIAGYIEVAGALFGSTRRANGDLVLLHPADGLLVTRLDGTLIHRLPQSGPGTAYGRIHHDVTATPTNTVLFIANETQVVGTETVVGEALWDWNPEAGTVVRRWSAFDHLAWPADAGERSVAGNWLHGNGISFGPRGNVVMSLRNADRIISIAPDFSRLEWKLGGTTSTLALADADRFFGQHYVTEPALGRLLVYDNGFDRPGGAYTRAIEYAIDTQAGTATRVWQYRASPDIYSSLVGSARRLPNGNTTVLFGMLGGQSGSSGPLSAVEVTPAGAVVWRMTVSPQLTRLYRVTPVASLLGEQPGSFAGR
ncbi:MAG: aryl-sulfate sulfotransferase [Gemmatimonadaceae bacterium]|nr:aryl-sulfate sulfotransferase [Gemmatimonadaceae bacterium]